MGKLAIRLVVALITFTAGFALTLLRVSYRSRTTKEPARLERAAENPRPDFSPPEGWQRIDVSSLAVLYLPPDMKPAKVFGESSAYRQEFSNSDMRINIAYGEPESCKTPARLLEEPSYRESIKEIGGRRAKLESFQLDGFRFVSACFPETGVNSTQLDVTAIDFKDGVALQTVERVFSSVKFK
jgi:hypothetical protein